MRTEYILSGFFYACQIGLTGRGNRQPKAFFDHAAMVERYAGPVIDRGLARGRHFFDDGLVWNGAMRTR